MASKKEQLMCMGLSHWRTHTGLAGSPLPMYFLYYYKSKGFGSIYIGYGYKLTQDCFSPISPQDIEVEGKETDEFDEPNPSNPPD